MIRLFQYLVLLFIVGLGSCTQSVNNPKSLNQISRFEVIPLIVSPGLDQDQLMKNIIQSLEKVGIVHRFTTASEQPMNSAPLTLWIGNIAEEKLDDNLPSHYFPVIWISLQISEAVEILKNKSKKVCQIWRRDYYVAQTEEVRDTTLETSKRVNLLIHRFSEEYQKANPGQKPIFFIQDRAG